MSPSPTTRDPARAAPAIPSRAPSPHRSPVVTAPTSTDLPPDAAPDELAAAGTRGRPAARRHAGRLQRRAADAVYALLLLALLLLAGWHAARHEIYWDWSSQGRNSLSPESVALLATLHGPLRITVYAAPDHPVSRAIEQLLIRYRGRLPDLRVDHVDPQRFPERARDADVDLIGQMVLDYRGRRETLHVLSEASLSNAIARLALDRKPWVAVLEGHGERAVDGRTDTDLGRFAQLLHQRAFRLQPLDLARAPVVPDNTDLLLVSTPAIDLFPGESEALVDYVRGGGNLLWLLDPGGDEGALRGLAPLARELGLRVLPGQVVDAAAAGLGLDAPTFAVVEDWSGHAITRDLDRAALFPGAVALELEPGAYWQLAAALRTGPVSWNETGPVRGEIRRDDDAGEQAGPLAVALILTRPGPGAADRPLGASTAGDAGADDERGIRAGEHRSEPPDQPATGPSPEQAGATEQRVIIVGDGDFLSNAHLDKGANQTLGLRTARWLTGQEDLVSVGDTVDDTDALLLSPVRGWLIAGIGLIALPLLLATAGILIRWRRGRA